MVEISASSTVVIDAPPERVLTAVADYVIVRPKILTSPPDEDIPDRGVLEGRLA
jgi:hypothetical protein